LLKVDLKRRAKYTPLMIDEFPETVTDLQTYLVYSIDKRVKAGEKREINILHYNIHASRTNMRNDNELP
jgi:hypothetical protein